MIVLLYLPDDGNMCTAEREKTKNGGAKMKHYNKSSGLQMFFTGAAIAVMFIIILCADSLIEFIL